jgi:hypothetical protein
MSVFKAISIGLVIIIVAIFLKREWFSSRFVILAGGDWHSVRFVCAISPAPLTAIFGGSARYRCTSGAPYQRKQKTKFFARLFQESKMLGYRVIDTISDANLHVIKDIRKKKGIDEIILCDPSVPDAEQEKLIDYCSIHNIGYSYVPTSLQTAKFSLRMLGGEPIFSIAHTPLDGWNKILKRGFDILASTILIILFSRCCS